MLFPCTPRLSTLTIVVETAPASSKIPSRSVSRSRTKTSEAPLVSPVTRLLAVELKATKRSSPLNVVKPPPPLPRLPALSTLIMVVAPVWRSCTKSSETLLVSPVTRLVALDRNPTKRPSPLMLGD